MLRLEKETAKLIAASICSSRLTFNSGDLHSVVLSFELAYRNVVLRVVKAIHDQNVNQANEQKTAPLIERNAATLAMHSKTHELTKSRFEKIVKSYCHDKNLDEIKNHNRTNTDLEFKDFSINND